MTNEPRVQLSEDCERVVRNLWQFLDHELDAPTMKAIEEHLTGCAPCCSHVEFEEELLRKLKDLRKEHSQPAVLRTKVVDALRAAGMGS